MQHCFYYCWHSICLVPVATGSVQCSDMLPSDENVSQPALVLVSLRLT